MVKKAGYRIGGSRDSESDYSKNGEAGEEGSQACEENEQQRFNDLCKECEKVSDGLGFRLDLKRVGSFLVKVISAGFNGLCYFFDSIAKSPARSSEVDTPFNITMPSYLTGDFDNVQKKSSFDDKPQECGLMEYLSGL